MLLVSLVYAVLFAFYMAWSVLLGIGVELRRRTARPIIRPSTVEEPTHDLRVPAEQHITSL